MALPPKKVSPPPAKKAAAPAAAKKVPTPIAAPPPSKLVQRITDGSEPAANKLVNLDGISAEDLLKDAGKGMEAMDSKDFALPSLSIAQPLSPVCNKQDDAYIDGIEPGMIYDTVSHELWDGAEGLSIIFVDFKKSDIEYIPRAKGGGFVADHGPNSDAMRHATRVNGAAFLPNGNELVETVQYYSIRVDRDSETLNRTVLSFYKTLMAESRRLATLASTYQIDLEIGGKVHKIVPALFYRVYRVTTSPKKNDKGHWFVWSVSPEEDTLDLFPDTGRGVEAYKTAQAFKEMISAGKVKVNPPSAGDGTSGGGGRDESAPM